MSRINDDDRCPGAAPQVDTYVHRLPRDEPQRPVLTHLVSAKQYFRERLIKTGRFTLLNRDHWRVLEVLIELAHLPHWKATGELFAFPTRQVLEEITKIGVKNSRRVLLPLEKCGLIQCVDRVIHAPRHTSGFLLIVPDECDSEEWSRHFNSRGDRARRRAAEQNQPSLFEAGESPVTTRVVAGDSLDDLQKESPVTPQIVAGDSAGESPVTPSLNNERACAQQSTLSNSSSSARNAAAADLEKGTRIRVDAKSTDPQTRAASPPSPPSPDRLAAHRVLKDLHIGRATIRELLSLPTSDYRTVRAAQIEASKSHVPNKVGLTISLVRHPERISDWALEEVDRRAAQAQAAQRSPAAPSIDPKAVVLSPEAKALLASSKTWSATQFHNGAEHGNQ